jgi:hypothetical protein
MRRRVFQHQTPLMTFAIDLIEPCNEIFTRLVNHSLGFEDNLLSFVYLSITSLTFSVDLRIENLSVTYIDRSIQRMKLKKHFIYDLYVVCRLVVAACQQCPTCPRPASPPRTWTGPPEVCPLTRASSSSPRVPPARRRRARLSRATRGA